ncbi:MAG: trigger factor [Syntrophomonadaceae bacterium]|nr:trigger factor [Syntrophomonadaceae bacterium]
MEAKLEKIENSEAYIEVEVDAEKLETGLEKAYRKVAKQVSIPGFRKGKVPRPLLEAHFGKEILYQDALEYIIPEAYQEAVEKLNIEPIAQPEFDISEIEAGKALKFSAKVPLKPEVKLGNLEGLEIKIPKIEVTEKDVDNRLEEMRIRYAELIVKEEEPAELKDVLTINFEGFIDGEPFEGGKGEDYQLELGSSTFIPGFEEQLVGVRAGESKEVNVTFPESYGAEDLAGKEAVFKVEVKKIETKKPRELNDEFAQEVSQFDTLAELREDIEKALNEMVEFRKQEIIKGEILAEILNKCEVTVPEAIVNAQIQKMLQGFEQRLASQGLTLENYLQYTNSTEEDLKNDIKADAERMVKGDFILEKVIEEKGIEVNDEELDKKVEELGRTMGLDLDQAREKLVYMMDEIRFNLKMDKAVQYLIDNASIKEMEPPGGGVEIKNEADAETGE